MKTCPRCGVENKSEKAACWNCWAPLESAGAAAEPKPTGRGLSLAVPWTTVIIIVLVLAALAGIYFFFLSSKPAQVASEYLHAVRNGNEAKAARLSTPDTAEEKLLQGAILLQDYEVDASGVQAEGKQAEVPASAHLTVDPLTIGLERAMLADALMKALQKQPVRANVVLVKKGLKWQVDQARTRDQFLQAARRGMPPELVLQLAAAATARPTAQAAATPPPAPGAGGAAALRRPPGAGALGGGTPAAAAARRAAASAAKKPPGALGARRAAESEAEQDF